MASLNKIKAYWLFQIIGWLIYGISQLFLYSWSGQAVDRMFVTGEGLQIVLNIFLTHCFRLVIIRFRWLNWRMVKLIPMVLLAVLGLSLLSAIGLGAILSIEIGPMDLKFIIGPMILHTLESVFVFSFWSLAYFIYLYFERYNNSLKYEATVRETELNNLKSQLNPHFIFNALNSIRALVDENPEKSKEAITQLSHILRNSLNSDRQKLVPFSEELKTVRDYLGLESIRYEERLRTSIEIAKGSESFHIPPLMLQTLVENGIKHGVAVLTKGGEIKIKTRVEPDGLMVEIRNSGQIVEKKNLHEGFGIKNTRKRLEMIYGSDTYFHVSNETNDIVLTKIKIPK